MIPVEPPAQAVAYQSAAARLSLVYRLVTLPARSRTLLLTVPGRTPPALDGWEGDVVVDHLGIDPGRLAAYGTASFERVILHWSLDQFVASPPRRRSRSSRNAILREVHRILVPGGVVAGCVPNLFSPPGKAEGRPFGATSGRWRRRLERHGFQQLRLFVALPCADAPQVLIEARRETARHHFGLELTRAGDAFRPASRMLRRALVAADGTRHLLGSLVFMGRTRC
jgi:SAM-dependent methyltransferase